MHLMILRPDGLVAVNGAALAGLDLSALAPEVHAVHWHGAGDGKGSGEVERRDPATGAMLEPEALTDEADVLERFDAALAAHAAALAAAQAPAPPMPLEQARAMYLAAVDAEHEQALLRLTGHPTDAEKASWAGKVELARRLIEGHPLALDQEAFLTGRGLTTAPARMSYAAEVMGNSAKYWMLVGLADRVRSEAKARINAVTDAAQWLEVGAANRAARDAALAMVAPPAPEPDPEPAPQPDPAPEVVDHEPEAVDPAPAEPAAEPDPAPVEFDPAPEAEPEAAPAEPVEEPAPTEAEPAPVEPDPAPAPASGGGD